MIREVILEPTSRPGKCESCRGRAWLRCVCCGGKFCESCEPGNDHAVNPLDYEEELE